VNISIRKADPANAGELTDIAFAAKRDWDYPESWIQLWADELEVDADYVASNRVFTASDGKQILGWCAVTEENGELWLDYCWVLPAAAGRGIGRALVTRAYDVAAELQSPALKVIADPNAEGFYRKLGFRLVGQYPSVPSGRKLPVLEAPVPQSR
jgi:GNAT superfamily N-acetyltransferase